MHIERLTLSGFKTIESVDLYMTELNVMIGPNGSGKSNLMESIVLMARYATYKQAMTLGPAKMKNITRSNLNIDIRLDNKENIAGSFRPERDELRYEGNFREVSPEASAAMQTWKIHDFSTLGIAQFYNYKSDQTLDSHGLNLPHHLDYLKEQHPEEHEWIQRNFEKLHHTVRDWTHEQLSELSPGALRMLALITLLNQPKEAMKGLLMIEHPENGVSNYFLSVLAGMIESAVHTAQIIMTTHSSYLVNLMNPENLIVAERERYSKIKRLSTKQINDLNEHWLPSLRLGELWDKNLIGGRPV